MSKRAALKAYRPQAAGVVSAWIGALGFLIVGLSMVVSESQVGVSGVVVGVALLVFAASLIAVLITNRLIVTPDGLVLYKNLRKRFIPWASVRSFDVGRARSVLPWSSLAISTTSETTRADGISGTPSFVARVAEELRSFQREYVPSIAPDSL